MIKKALFGAVAAALLGCANAAYEATLDTARQDYRGALLRLPFHEILDCGNAFDIDSIVSSFEEMALELDKYLQKSLAPYDYLGVEDFSVASYDTARVNKSETAHSYLRHKTTVDKEDNPSEFSLELTGVAIFAANSTKHSSSVNLLDILPFSVVPGRYSMCYGRIAKLLAHNHDRLVTSPKTYPTAAAAAHTYASVGIPRRYLQSCASIVQARYSFTSDEFMCSENGAYFFGIDADGDLGIWKGFKRVWSAGISQQHGSKLTLQPDGNLVVRNAADVVLWESRTNGAADSGGEVQVADSGEVSITNSVAGKTIQIVPTLEDLQLCSTKMEGISRLMPGERICSQNKMYSFGLAMDGDLGIFFGPKQVWSAGSCCRGDGTLAHLQTDGNFVVRSGSGDVLWESSTQGDEGSSAVVTLGSSGVVTIENRNSGKTVTIEPLHGVKPVTGEEAQNPTSDSCIEQVNGRTDLRLGEFICSSNGRYRFGVDLDGDLKLVDGSNEIWSAGTCCAQDGVHAILQESDGNLVVLTSNAELLWSSRTGAVENANSSLSLYDTGTTAIVNSLGRRMWGVTPQQSTCFDQSDSTIVLEEGQFICSSSGRFRFGVVDGDLSLWDTVSLVWSLSLGSRCPGVYMHMQGDGNLVVRNQSGDALWTSRTAGNSGSFLNLDDNGFAEITSSDGTMLWTTSDLGFGPGPPPQVPLPSNLPPTPEPYMSPTKHPPSQSPDPKYTCLEPVQGRVLLTEGDFFCSPNRIFKFGLAPDGDLALFDGPRKIWTANTCCTGEDVTARLQVDGNLVVRTAASDQVLWTSQSVTLDVDVASLIVRNDGVVTITDTVLGVLWSTGVFPPSPSPPSRAPPTSRPPISRAPPIDPSLLPCLVPVRGRVDMSPGDFFCSPNGKYKFGVSPDGGLVLFEGPRTIWNANTCCTGDDVTATLQVDGNLVVTSPVSKQVIWASHSSNLDAKDASLKVGDDGIVTITDTILGHLWSSAIADERDRVVPDSLVGKVMAGYQGWFFADGDGGINQWVHWSRPHQVPSRSSVTIDAWPDLSELDNDELYPTEFRYKDGSNAGLYSAYNAKTVERHNLWCKAYGVHGLFVQRFIGNVKAPKWRAAVNKVLANVRSGAEKYGRTFANMYDIGNGDEATIVEDVINDWKHLVDEQHITKSRQYLYHRGRPLVAIWGFGFYDRLGSPRQVARLLDWFQNKAEDKYKATVMGGVPTGWRDLSRDSQSSSEWAAVYRSYDVISPWAVGRIVDVRTANYQRRRYIEGDLAECTSLGIDYLPVVFPGFSFNNLKPIKPFNEIPRDGGRFMWHQMHNAVSSGSKMLYVAMFDEVDEATAIFKIADNQQQTPVQGRFLAADTDGFSNCPGDWYLNITGTVAGLIEKGKDVPLNMPSYP